FCHRRRCSLQPGKSLGISALLPLGEIDGDDGRTAVERPVLARIEPVVLCRELPVDQPWIVAVRVLPIRLHGLPRHYRPAARFLRAVACTIRPFRLGERKDPYCGSTVGIAGEPDGSSEE